MRALAIAAMAGLLSTACGGTDPGGGTGTLFVTLEAEGRPDSTRIRAVLNERGNPVIGANVVVTHIETSMAMNLESAGSEGSNGSRYEGTFGRYARTLQVDITSGDNRLDARLVGPSPHVITRPPNDVIAKRADFDFLTVRWESDDRADRATVTVGELEPIEFDDDPGVAEVPLGGLPNGTHEIEVKRESSIELAGGVEGSVMRIRYKVDNRFTLEG